MNITGISNSTVGQGPKEGKSGRISSEQDVLVLKRAQDIAKQEGQALVNLIHQASDVIRPDGRVDLYA
jgi:hypothetical protein